MPCIAVALQVVTGTPQNPNCRSFQQQQEGMQQEKLPFRCLGGQCISQQRELYTKTQQYTHRSNLPPPKSQSNYCFQSYI